MTKIYCNNKFCRNRVKITGDPNSGECSAKEIRIYASPNKEDNNILADTLCRGFVLLPPTQGEESGK